MIVINEITGEGFSVNPRWARLKHLRGRIFAWANVLKPYADVNKRYRMVMIRLSYAKDGMWRPNHIRDFMLVMRERLGSNLVAYAWVAELTKIGRVHYHVLVLVKPGVMVPRPDAERLWVYGSTRTEQARTVFYIASYVGKEYQKLGYFPKGLRTFAVWLNTSIVTENEYKQLRLSALPRWLSNDVLVSGLFDDVLSAVKLVGGGWSVGGKIFRSPYSVMFDTERGVEFDHGSRAFAQPAADNQMKYYIGANIET